MAPASRQPSAKICAPSGASSLAKVTPYAWTANGSSMTPSCDRWPAVAAVITEVPDGEAEPVRTLSYGDPRQDAES